jgi:hypothetical protein
LGNTIGTDQDVFVSRSTNAGSTWTAPAPLNTTAATDGTASENSPMIATDRAGVWIAVFGSNTPLNDTSDYDAYFARSTDNGATWEDPLPLNSNAAADAGEDFLIKVAADGDGHWVAVWQSTDSLGGTIGGDRDILECHSSDDGETWSTVQPLNTNADSDTGDDFEPQITTDESGNWLVVWYSENSLNNTIGTDNDVLIARSTNNGQTWSAPQPLNSNAAVDTGGDIFPTIATDAKGRWIGGWSTSDTLGNTKGTDADVVFAISDQLSNGTLSLVAPNGGEKWPRGKRRTIEWTSTGDPGSEVMLELLRNGGVVTTIKSSTGNDGNHKWKIPQGLAAGTKYKVRITSTGDPNIKDESDKGFRIKAAK